MSPFFLRWRGGTTARNATKRIVVSDPSKNGMLGMLPARVNRHAALTVADHLLAGVSSRTQVGQEETTVAVTESLSVPIFG